MLDADWCLAKVQLGAHKDFSDHLWELHGASCGPRDTQEPEARCECIRFIGGKRAKVFYMKISDF